MPDSNNPPVASVKKEARGLWDSILTALVALATSAAYQATTGPPVPPAPIPAHAIPIPSVVPNPIPHALPPAAPPDPIAGAITAYRDGLPGHLADLATAVDMGLIADMDGIGAATRRKFAKAEAAIRAAIGPALSTDGRTIANPPTAVAALRAAATALRGAHGQDSP